jgi:hypothetical protein
VSGGIFGHADPRLDIFLILGDEAGTVHAHVSVLTDPAIGAAGDADSTARTSAKKGSLASSITSAARRTADHAEVPRQV